MKIDSQQLIKIIAFWQEVAKEGPLDDRALVDTIDTQTREVVDIVGVRRGGKSSILKLLIQRLQLKDNFLYINFEDPFFIDHDDPQIVEELIATYKEYFSTELRYLFFDEIQAVRQWEKAIRKLRDAGKYKVYVTGSSSKLLSGELATLLTGRHLSYELLPLSFAEYLQFKGVELKAKKDIVLKSKTLLKNFSDYLSIGGFPEVVLTGNQTLLKQYFFDIIQKDIVMRHAVRETGKLEKMAVFLMSNASKIVSLESLKKTFTISYKMVSTYIDYFKESFLLFEIPQFSHSLKKQAKALKKYYAIDCGLANVAAFRFSEDKGRILENAVYLHLLRSWKTIYYYRTKNNLEVDFLVKSAGEKKAIQVAWSLADEKTRDRELRALLTTLDELKLKTGVILTYDEEDEVKIDGKTITITPVYKWMLG